MKKTSFLIVTAILLSACAQRGPTDEQIATADYGRVPKNPQKTVIEHAKMQLYDPQSAQYEKWSNLIKGWTFDYAGTHYGYKGCVYINSKNRMGGYVGFKPYVYIIKNDKVIFINGDMRSGSRGELEVMQQCSDIYQQAKTMTELERTNIGSESIKQQEQQVRKPLPVRMSE